MAEFRFTLSSSGMSFKFFAIDNRSSILISKLIVVCVCVCVRMYLNSYVGDGMALCPNLLKEVDVCICILKCVYY